MGILWRSRIMSDVTQILADIDRGDPRAAERLLPLVYDELRKLAARRLAQEKPGQTLQATALVHEAYLRLVGAIDPGWEGTDTSLPPLPRRCARLLVDAARRKGAGRHGGGRRVTTAGLDMAMTEPAPTHST